VSGSQVGANLRPLGLLTPMPSDATEKTGNSGRKSQSHPAIDRVIAELAERQHGVVAVWQLEARGIAYDAIRYRARTGRLHRIHHGVYAVGYRKLTPHGHRMAAVLAYGPDAVLSHRSAAAQWGIGPGFWKTEVTTPRAKRSRKGTRAHTATLHPEDVAVHNGIPVTSVARTILDLAAQLKDDPLTRLIEDADRAELIDLHALERAISRRPRVAGVVRLKAVLAAYRGPADTRSKLERDFRALIAAAGLPEPRYNVLVAGLTVDVFWPQWKLVVELDGRPYHANPRAFETDRIRDARLQKVDLRVLRVTGQRLDNEPGAVVEDILALRRPE
jgi:very-short-patch-repair endonuclease/predicted transcriptional regulator of viral defense system